MQLSVFNRSNFSNPSTSYLYNERALQENGICLLSTLRPSQARPRTEADPELEFWGALIVFLM